MFNALASTNCHYRMPHLCTHPIRGRKFHRTPSISSTISCKSSSGSVTRSTRVCCTVGFRTQLRGMTCESLKLSLVCAISRTKVTTIDGSNIVRIQHHHDRIINTISEIVVRNVEHRVKVAATTVRRTTTIRLKMMMPKNALWRRFSIHFVA